MNAVLLFAARNPRARARTTDFGRTRGFVVREASTAREGLELAEGLRPDIVVVDRGDADEASAFENLREESARPAVLVIDSDGGEDLEYRLEAALRVHTLERENARLRQDMERSRPTPLLGDSGRLRRMLEIVGRVASTPRTTVLVTGELGSGKRAVAREIHRQSSRWTGPFVSLHCSSLSSQDLVQGLGQAESGTLFLDEVCELSLEIQTELAAFLQERQVRRDASAQDMPADVRVVAATRHDPARMVTEHRLREDLAYRLNVLTVDVPPLRLRREDLPALVQNELGELAAELGGRPCLSAASLTSIGEHCWPGNHRELKNALERGALLAGSRPIEPEDLGLGPAASKPKDASEDVLPLGDRSLRFVEEALIRRVLDEASGNRSRAARVLGINRTTLYNKLKQYGIADA
jgi:DNA-binding NtrC family response regulator